MITLESFNDYLALLASHDWFYDYSDDISVSRRGRKTESAILDQATMDPMYKAAYLVWHGYVYGSTRAPANRAARDRALNELRLELLVTT